MFANLRLVMRLPQYRKYFAAALLAAIGSGMYFVAVSWYLFKTSGSTLAIGWSFIATTLPGLLLSPVVGVLLDRWKSRHVCAAADVLRGAILVAMALGMASGQLQAWHIYVASFLIALCDNFFQPAVGALVRDVVARENLLPANIVGSMAIQVGLLLGASVGGFAVAAFGTETVVGLNAATFLASAVLILWVRHQPAASASTAARVTGEGVLAQFGRALRETPERGFLALMVVQQLLAYLTVFMCNTLLPGFVVRELKSGAEGFGLIDAGWGLGAMCGGLLLGLLLKRWQAARVGAGCLAALGAALALFSTVPGVTQAAAVYAVLGGLGVMLRINGDTEIARHVAPAHFGKIKSGVVMLVSWSSLVVYAIAGYLGDTVSARHLYLGMAALTLGTGVLMLLVLRMQRRAAPQAPNPLQPLAP